MRFCTSELKTAVICAYLVKRFPGQTIISVSGIRREESPNCAKAPVAKAQQKLISSTHQTTGVGWHPTIDWDRDPHVLPHIASHNVPLHEAYTRYGSSRVSCADCILASRADLAASAACTDNQAIYRLMVDLEIRSTFSFQERGWLGDIAPHLLMPDQIDGLAAAKIKAQVREEAEASIPTHLLYSAGWPTALPTFDEAVLLADVRRTVADSIRMPIKYDTPERILARYAELLMLKKEKETKKAAPDLLHVE